VLLEPDEIMDAAFPHESIGDVMYLFPGALDQIRCRAGNKVPFHLLARIYVQGRFIEPEAGSRLSPG